MEFASLSVFGYSAVLYCVFLPLDCVGAPLSSELSPEALLPEDSLDGEATLELLRLSVLLSTSLPVDRPVE